MRASRAWDPAADKSLTSIREIVGKGVNGSQRLGL